MKNNNTILISKVDDFNRRFLDFAKRYDKLKCADLLKTATMWVETSNYDYIRYFLKTDSYEQLVPFSLKEFASMSNIEMAAWHNYCMEIQYLLDEKNSLYNELISYL